MRAAVFNWAQTLERCRRFGLARLARFGARRHRGRDAAEYPGDERAAFRGADGGSVLNTLNIRLDAASIAFKLDHGGAKVILVDPEFAGVIAEALTLIGR